MTVGTPAAGMMLIHAGCSGPAWDFLMQLTPMCLFPEFPFLTLGLFERDGEARFRTKTVD